MSPEEWQRVKEIFQEAVERAPAERAAFLDEFCASDVALRGEVESLLEWNEPAQGFIEEPAISPVDLMLNDSSDDGLEAGRRIGRYKIVRKIGRGGMGVVYLAERDDLGGQVAIKVLPNAFLSSARRHRFTSEQRTLAKLNHQFIAQLYDADVLADGTPWFAMEYVDGVKITEYCGARSIEESLELFRSVCEAVQYAHGQMVLHRDLKPSNIL